MGNSPSLTSLYKEIQVIRHLIASAFLATFLAACGGGGDGGSSNPPPTEQLPSPVVSPAPSTGSGIDGSDHRATIMAATAAATTPAAGTAGALPVVSAGEIQIDGGAQYVTFTKSADGKYYGLSDALGTYLVDPANVKQICVNSSQIGWNVPGYTSRSCSPLDVNGFAVLPLTCNKDRVAYNLDTNDGKKLWLDHTSERKFVRKGIPSTLRADGLIDYGGYTPATITAKAGTTAGTVDITYNWQNNCMGGFGKEGKLTNLNPNLPETDPNFRYIGFVMNTNKEGWGITAIGDRMPVPMDKMRYASFDTPTGAYKVTFTGLKCNDKGNITVYEGTGTSTAVTYDPGKDALGVVDGFGAGWGIIQAGSDPFQFWAIAPGLPTGMSLSFDRTKFQLVWALAGCTT